MKQASARLGQVPMEAQKVLITDESVQAFEIADSWVTLIEFSC